MAKDENLGTADIAIFSGMDGLPITHIVSDRIVTAATSTPGGHILLSGHLRIEVDRGL